MITQAQKELLTSHGQAISELVSAIDQGNAALCIEWWEVGKELSKTSYHDGQRPGSISTESMVTICGCLGLSTKESRRHFIGGTSAVNKARRFYREFPTEEGRNKVIEEYKTWREVSECAISGKPPNPNAGSGSGKTRSKRQRGSKPSKNQNRLVPPHNAKILWEKAIQDFMASTGEDYATARKILFRVLSELDYMQAMRESWKMYQEESAR